MAPSHAKWMDFRCKSWEANEALVSDQRTLEKDALLRLPQSKRKRGDGGARHQDLDTSKSLARKVVLVEGSAQRRTNDLS